MVTCSVSRCPALSVHHLHNGDFLLEALNVFHLALTEWRVVPLCPIQHLFTSQELYPGMRLGVISNTPPGANHLDTLCCFCVSLG